MDAHEFAERLARLAERHFKGSVPDSALEGFAEGKSCIQRDAASLGALLPAALALAYESHLAYRAMADAARSAIPGASATHPRLEALARYFFEQASTTPTERGLGTLFSRIARLDLSTGREWANPHFARDPIFDRSRARAIQPDTSQASPSAQGGPSRGHAPAPTLDPAGQALAARASLIERTDAICRDNLAAPVDPKFLDKHNFPNGGCFVQHTVDGVAAFISDTLQLAYDADESYRSFVDKKIQAGKVAGPRDPRLENWCNQYLDGSGKKELCHLLARGSNMDPEDGSEWGQPYFARFGGRSERSKAICANPGEAHAIKEAAELRGSTSDPGTPAAPLGPRL